MELNVSYIKLRCKLFALVCQGLNVMLKSSIGGPLKCSINWPIQPWRLGGKAHDDGGQGGSWNEGFS